MILPRESPWVRASQVSFRKDGTALINKMPGLGFKRGFCIAALAASFCIAACSGGGGGSSQTVSASGPDPGPGVYTLTVSTLGAGSGLVSSAPVAISCPASCSAKFSSGTTVTLTATPSTGDSFAGWGEACLGTGATCMLTMSGPLTASATFAAVPSGSGNPNLIGINIDPPLDWEENRLYADIMKTSRSFTSYQSTSAVPLDANEWPTQDFSFIAFDQMANMNGTYTLKFNGSASVSMNGSPVTVSYDSTTNTSTGTFSIATNATTSMSFDFASTVNANGDSTNTGVTNITLMRPLSPGATQSYPSSTRFNNPLLLEISKFSVIRFMDFLATNSNQQVNWSDRMLPSSPSYQRLVNINNYGWEGLGGPWEDVILLGNETGKDVWINIPVNATDSYVTDVAKMLKYGSDGVNPYTSSQTNPLYPPLNPNLHVYIEYSNEVWNPDFSQFNDNCLGASNELSKGSAPINWDGVWDGGTWTGGACSTGSSTPDWHMCGRRIAERVVAISNDFRAVWGDAAMGTTIRPVLEGQFSYSAGYLFDGMAMLYGYYDNWAGSFVSTPHPPSYYIYGSGGAFYYNPETINPATNAPGTAAAVLQDPGMTPEASVVSNIQDESYISAALGVHHVAYEGGPNLVTTGNSIIDAAYAAAVADPSMTTTVENMHNAWVANGGELFTYFTSDGDYQWGFTNNIYNLSTPKLLAIDALNAAPAVSLAVGIPVPGSINLSAASNDYNGAACSVGYSCNNSSYTAAVANGNLNWNSYPFNFSSSASRTVTLSFGSVSSGTSVAAYLDGIQIGTAQSPANGSLSFTTGTVTPGLHSVIVRAIAGSFTLNSVSVN
jgi:hypothetical protein